ncbi:MAG TPA: diguanylate cyclase [Gammaproteobacteria bacterium]
MDQRILQQRARAFDYLFDAVVVTDLDGIIIDWNTGSEQLYGYARNEVIGKPVSMLHVAEDDERVTAEVLISVAKEGRWSGEVKMLHKDGSVGWIESVVVQLLNENGDAIGALGINRNISDRVENEERLAQLAHYDQLTGLPNRYLFIDRMQQLVHHATRHNRLFALLYIDLDDFKKVNDHFGHLVGDKVLQLTANKLQHAVRASDTVARIGGDEFVAMLERINAPDEAAQVADHILKLMHKPLVIDDKEITQTGSIGIAIYPRDGVTLDELLSHSDRAMYQVKHHDKDDFY